MAFDTLSYARRLKASGFSDQQAETLADATKELVPIRWLPSRSWKASWTSSRCA